MRLIDADYLIDTIGAMIGYGTTPTDIWDMVKDAPIIDLVRCGECKYRRGERLCMMWSKYGTIETSDDGYCYMARRRTEQAEREGE